MRIINFEKETQEQLLDKCGIIKCERSIFIFEDDRTFHIYPRKLNCIIINDSTSKFHPDNFNNINRIFCNEGDLVYFKNVYCGQLEFFNKSGDIIKDIESSILYLEYTANFTMISGNASRLLEPNFWFKGNEYVDNNKYESDGIVPNVKYFTNLHEKLTSKEINYSEVFYNSLGINIKELIDLDHNMNIKVLSKDKVVSPLALEDTEHGEIYDMLQRNLNDVVYSNMGIFDYMPIAFSNRSNNQISFNILNSDNRYIPFVKKCFKEKQLKEMSQYMYLTLQNSFRKILNYFNNIGEIEMQIILTPYGLRTKLFNRDNHNNCLKTIYCADILDVLESMVFDHETFRL